MTGKIFFLLISIGALVFVFSVNLFWRWLAIPIVALIAYDVFNSFLDKRKKQKNP